MSKDQSLQYWKKLGNRYEGPLKPIDRFSEMIFGLIMVLTFTCSLSAAESGKQEIGTMLWAAVGCNLAWGIVDALMFLMGRMVEKAEQYQSLSKIQNATDNEAIRQSVLEAIPPIVADMISVKHIDEIHQFAVQLPEPPGYSYLGWKDFGNAGIIFLLVFLSTFPVIIPFFFFYENPFMAIRLSNAIAVVLLFIAGYLLGRKTGYSTWLTGMVFTFIGIILVFMTIALGG